MKFFLRTILATIFILLPTTAVLASPKPIVKIDTNMGEIIVELNHRRAPGTVKNFLYYVKKEFYNSSIFHRVISDFMIQGGGFDTSLKLKSTRNPIRNESTNGLKNSVGTIAMARTEMVDSATSQFYINVKENRSLNADYGKPGYTVFGNVIEGLDVVMKIAATPVESIPGISENVPVEPVIIHSITLVEPEQKPAEQKSEKTKKTEQSKEDK